ncbi:hypothetical protein BEH94_04165 [Candidatus Altiarchaeales archaeon WOR_SM1_SCG]|nr:hypothetical protein BEH94_04165 [Candidatus Altiarchaeales archaeon WOR_SM1_SCG]
MKIDTCDICHIGIKLKPNVDLNVLKDRIEKILSESEYKIVNKGVIDGNGIVGNLIIGVKENTNIELNYVSKALNTVGKDPITVLTVFKELHQFLSDIDYDPEAIITFYEILTNMNAKSDKNPIDVLNNSSRVDLSPLADIGGVGVDGILISNKNVAQEYEVFNLIIEPEPTNPRNRFSVRLQYQSKNKENIISFYESLEGKITKIIESI